MTCRGDSYVPIDNEKIYAVAMNNFMAQGGDDNTFLIGRPYIDTGVPLSAEFESYLEEFSPLPCPVQPSKPRLIISFDEPTLPPSSAACRSFALVLLFLSSILYYFL